MSIPANNEFVQLLLKINVFLSTTLCSTMSKPMAFKNLSRGRGNNDLAQMPVTLPWMIEKLVINKIYVMLWN